MPEPSAATPGGVATSVAFLASETRVPDPLKRLLADADGCVQNGLLVGGTLCGQQALEELLGHEKLEGTTRQTRLAALSRKHPAVPQLFITVLGQFEERTPGHETVLDAGKLQLLTTTLRATAYEIYVLGAEREERVACVQRLLDGRHTASKPVLKSPPSPTSRPLITRQHQISTTPSASVA